MVSGDSRLRPEWIDAFGKPENSLSVSVIVAFEYTDLLLRRRLPIDESLDRLIERFNLTIEDFPGECWRLLNELPRTHQDPVDRMLVAHALHEGMTLITADANIRRYPVACI
jgi:PIN domain nuclease of toxin-antitoxin system